MSRRDKANSIGTSLQVIWRGLLTIVIALVISLSLVSGMFARYNTATGSGATGHVAGFNPSIEYTELASVEASLSDFGLNSKTVVPFHVDNKKNEVTSELVITVKTKGILPLSMTLFDAKEEELADARMLYPSIMTEDSSTYVVNVGFDSADFSLVVEWGDTEYSELFAGLSDTVSISVVSRQTT